MAATTHQRRKLQNRNRCGARANVVPSFTKGPDQPVLEDGGAKTVTGWATNISSGPAKRVGPAGQFPCLKQQQLVVLDATGHQRQWNSHLHFGRECQWLGHGHR